MRKSLLLTIFVLNIHLSLIAQSNTGTGYQALFNNLWGSNNTATGHTSLYTTSNSISNTAHGAFSMYYNTSGYYNTAIGGSAAHYNTTGYDNVAVGHLALFYNNIGFRNVAVGIQSLILNIPTSSTNGVYNTGFGYFSLSSNSTGNFNLGIGVNSGTYNQAGSYNTFIGAESNGALFGNYRKSSAIGSNAKVTGDYMIIVGSNAVTKIEGQASWSTPSDRRIKTEIKENVPGLRFIKSLTPYTYNYDYIKLREIIKTKPPQNDKKELEDVLILQEKNKEKIRHTGLLAQDVETVANKIGYKFSGVNIPSNKNDQTYSLKYAEFVVPLVKSTQELSRTNDSLRNEIEQLELAIESAERVLDSLDRKKDFKTIVNSVTENNKINKESDKTNHQILQINPNPLINTSVVRYYISDESTAHFLLLSNNSGTIVKRYQLPSKSGYGQISINKGSLGSGGYSLSLINSKGVIISKQIVIITK